jgi:hypothetical protein
MERLDQGHLHPKLKISRLTCLGQELNPDPPQWEASTLAKSYSNSILIAIQNIYISASNSLKIIINVPVVYEYIWNDFEAGNIH